jgi:hypothetical protein
VGFLFSACHLLGADFCEATEDSSLRNIKDDSKSLKTIGIIRVIVQRVDITKDAQGRLAPFEVKSKLQVHEKALKGQAITHGTGYNQIISASFLADSSRLGLPKPAKYSEIFSTTSLDGVDYPLAIFTFKYRSKGLPHQTLGTFHTLTCL